MIVKLIGGPADGEIREIVGEPYYQTYRATQGWTLDGVRLYVAPDFDHSLIGDTEIDTAAHWLAEQDRPWSDLQGTALQEYRNYHAAYHRAALRSARIECLVPDAVLGRCVHGEPECRRFYAHVSPGCVLGFRSDQARPIFVWPEAARRRIEARWRGLNSPGTPPADCGPPVPHNSHPASDQ